MLLWEAAVLEKTDFSSFCFVQFCVGEVNVTGNFSPGGHVWGRPVW